MRYSTTGGTILRNVQPLFAELAGGRTLGVIVFALLLGLALAASGPAGVPAIKVFKSLFDGVMRLVLWVLWVLEMWLGALGAGATRSSV